MIITRRWWLGQFKHLRSYFWKKTRLFKKWNYNKLLSYLQILYFLYFTRLEALFNYPRWMEIVWLPSAEEVRSVSLVTWPNLNMRDLKTTSSSGFSKLGLCYILYNTYWNLIKFKLHVNSGHNFKAKLQYVYFQQVKKIKVNFFDVKGLYLI